MEHAHDTSLTAQGLRWAHMVVMCDRIYGKALEESQRGQRDISRAIYVLIGLRGSEW